MEASRIPWLSKIALALSAMTHKTTFNRGCVLPNFRHLFMSIVSLKERLQNGKEWDKAAGLEFRAERQVSPRADIQLLPDRPRTAAATGPLADWQLP